MSNMAFEITEEDVINVLSSNPVVAEKMEGKSISDIAVAVFANLDFELIEDEALMGDDLDQQTDYANDEIARQLREMGLLAPLPEEYLDTPKG